MQNTNAKKLLNDAKQHTPQGVGDNYRYWGEENTVFVKTMQGCEITDVDDNTFMDVRLAYGPIILGYRDERVNKAVIDVINNVGTISGFNSGLEAEVISLVKQLCPQIESLRFTNSGTEAVLGAVRTARGFTSKNKVVVVEGGFHGLYDEMMWKSDVDNWDGDKDTNPDIMPFGIGIPKSTQDHSITVQLNDFDAIDGVFNDVGDDIACVVVEAIMGNCGSISTTPEYMQKLRDICNENGALLIVDEVKTGFRVAKGGAQELYGVHADLTTYAKAMGNGFAVAAFGGRADVMANLQFGKHGVTHGGTYTANMVALSAAKATLEILLHTDALESVNKAGKNFQDVLSRVFTKHGIEHRFAGPDAMFGIHFGDNVPQNYRDWKRTDSALYEKFAWKLIEHGVMLEPDSREPWFICEAHKNVDLVWLESVADKAMTEAKAQM